MGKHKGKRISVTLAPGQVKRLEDLMADSGQKNRSRTMAAAVDVCHRLMQEHRAEPAAAPSVPVGQEVREMFDNYEGWERPEYGRVPVRHNNRDRYGAPE